MSNKTNSGKELVSGKKGIFSFPGFPLVIGCIGKNLITVAAISMVSFDNPPLIMMGIVPKRYSFELIKKIQNYSVNIPTTELLEAVQYCGKVSGRDVEDKFEGAGLTPVRASKISSYLIKECPVNLECKVVHTLDMGGTHTWFIGEVVAAHIAKNYDKSNTIMFWPAEYRYVGNVIKIAKNSS